MISTSVVATMSRDSTTAAASAASRSARHPVSQRSRRRVMSKGSIRGIVEPPPVGTPTILGRRLPVGRATRRAAKAHASWISPNCHSTLPAIERFLCRQRRLRREARQHQSGGSVMVSYRCYLINAEDHIVKSWAIETASEDEAVAAAEQ